LQIWRNQLQEQLEEHQKEKVASQYHNRTILWKYFQGFVLSIQLKKINEDKAATHRLRKVMAKWRKYSSKVNSEHYRIQCFQRVAVKTVDLNNIGLVQKKKLKKCFKLWRQEFNTRMTWNSTLRVHNQQKKTKKLQSVFQIWKNFTQISQETRYNKNKAVEIHQRHVTKKHFRIWRIYVVLERKEIDTLRKAYDAWLMGVRVQNLERHAQNTANTVLKHQFLNLWAEKYKRLEKNRENIKRRVLQVTKLS
jgi:hypothetical protein